MNDAYNTAPQCVLVPDTLQFLQQLANYHRRKLNIPILGITGTNGKTTTKELCFSVLSKKYKTVATKGNLNNHIGVPLTLLSMDASTEFGIVEMGANHPGEIKELCQIAEPTTDYHKYRLCPPRRIWKLREHYQDQKRTLRSCKRKAWNIVRERRR